MLSCCVRMADPSLRGAQFLYINASFSPAPDDTVANLFKVGHQSVVARTRAEADKGDALGCSASRPKDT